MQIWFVLVGIAAALGLGVAANKWWMGGHRAEGDEGFGISDLVGPVTTLAVILLAFVVVEALGSYDRARDHVRTEARVVGSLGESAVRVKDPAVSRQLQQDLVCYARAVGNKEFGSMAHGDSAPEVGVWTQTLQTHLTALLRSGGDDELSRLIDLDNSRAEARLARLTESKPTIPAGLNALMLGSVLVSVFGLTVFVNIKGRPEVYLGLLTVFAAVLAGTLYMIYDLDSPFSGVNKIQATQIATVQQSMERTFARLDPGAPLPCDALGVQTQ